MACITPDGKPTESGQKMLIDLRAGAKSAEEVARNTGLPLFKVRSGLRELTEAGFATLKGEGYELSAAGAELLGKMSA